MTIEFEPYRRRGAPESGIGMDTMRHADNQALVAYWNRLRAGRPCPLRSEVDPREIDCAVGNLFILEDLGRGNIRFRLAGSSLVDAFWMELRGMPVHAIMAGDARQSLSALVTETLEEPGIGQATLARSGASGGAWELALLPLRSGRGEIDRVLGGLYPLDQADARPSNPPLTFAIEAMQITPVTTMAAAAAQRRQVGMAEVQDAWAGAPRHLRAIDGGLGGGDMGERVATAPEAPARPRLRVVKSED